MLECYSYCAKYYWKQFIQSTHIVLTKSYVVEISYFNFNIICISKTHKFIHALRTKCTQCSRICFIIDIYELGQNFLYDSVSVNPSRKLERKREWF
jgi:heterodisulfide reductase subunit A-like polyferredoxin